MPVPDVLHQDAFTRVARALGACRVWVLDSEALADLGVEFVSVLGGTPVACLDVRELAAAARASGNALAVDLTEVSGVGCPALRLGAQLVSFSPDGVHAIVGASRDVPDQLRTVLDERSVAVGAAANWLDSAVDDLAERHRRSSDAAQVVAHYLVCHPGVSRVAYPGLRSDDSHEVAARTLQSGFGPRVSWLPAGGGAWSDLVLAPDDDPLAVISRLEKGELGV